MRDLRGLRIALTRSAAGCHAWGAALERRGAVPVSFPCLEHRTLDTLEARNLLAGSLEGAGWLALSSPRAVDSVVQLLDGELRSDVAVAAVGPATAAAALRAWGRVDLRARGGTAKSLARGLLRVADTRIVLAVAEEGRRELQEALEREGRKVTRVPVYRTVILPELASRRPLRDQADVVLVASPSAVTGLLRRAELGPDLGVVSIGPTTTEAARTAGLSVLGEAAERSLDAMLEAIP